MTAGAGAMPRLLAHNPADITCVDVNPHQNALLELSSRHSEAWAKPTWWPIMRPRAEFMDALRNGRIRVEGKQGHCFTLASDILRIMGCFYRQGLMDPAKSPLEWRRQALGSSRHFWTSSDCVFASRGATALHSWATDSTRSLLFDLVARPAEESIVGYVKRPDVR